MMIKRSIIVRRKSTVQLRVKSNERSACLLYSQPDQPSAILVTNLPNSTYNQYTVLSLARFLLKSVALKPLEKQPRTTKGSATQAENRSREKRSVGPASRWKIRRNVSPSQKGRKKSLLPASLRSASIRRFFKGRQIPGGREGVAKKWGGAVFRDRTSPVQGRKVLKGVDRNGCGRGQLKVRHSQLTPSALTLEPASTRNPRLD